MSSVEFFVFKTENEYKEKYREFYLTERLLFFDIPIIFEEKTFDHIFSEPREGGKREFSKRRAKRLLFMKAILSGNFEIEIMYERESGKKIGNCALFCQDLECVMYLRFVKGSGMQVLTFFDFGKDHMKMYLKQKKKCIPITLPEIKSKL